MIYFWLYGRNTLAPKLNAILQGRYLYLYPWTCVNAPTHCSSTFKFSVVNNSISYQLFYKYNIFLLPDNSFWFQSLQYLLYIFIGWTITSITENWHGTYYRFHHNELMNFTRLQLFSITIFTTKQENDN